MSPSLQMALFGLCLNVLSAQDKPSLPLITPAKVEVDTKLRKAKTTATAQDTNLPSLSNFDAFTNLVVQPGQSQAFTSSADWTGSDRVSIAIECPTSTSLQNVLIVVQWALPAVAQRYTATDVIFGKNLLLPNMGGSVVPTYGNQLQIVLFNNGTTTVACDQLTVYAVVH